MPKSGTVSPPILSFTDEGITHCWELLDPKVFDTLAESMVERVEAVIAAEGWYSKY